MIIVKKCVYCQSKRFKATKLKITPIISKAPRKHYIGDLVNLKAYSKCNNNNSWMLVMVDSLSKFGMVRVTQTKTTGEISLVFKELFYTYGPPIILHTYNGKEFKNSSVSELCKKFGVIQVHGRARALWIQGQVEQLNQSIKRWISSTSASNNQFGQYMEILQSIVYKYNNTKHATTKETPFFTFMGAKSTFEVTNSYKERPLAFDFEHEVNVSRENALFNTKIAAKKMIMKRKWQFDEDSFQINDCVLLLTDSDVNALTRKHQLYDHINVSVYRIIEIRDKLVDLVDDLENVRLNVHRSLIKKLIK